MNAGAFAEKPRGNYTRVVEHDEFIAAKEIGESREWRIFYLPTRALYNEHAGSIPAIERTLSNQTWRQFVVEVVYTHGAQL